MGKLKAILGIERNGKAESHSRIPLMHTCTYDAFGRGVCLCDCPQDNLTAIADICFLLGDYVDRRKISDEFARQDHMSRSRSRSFFRWFDKYMTSY